MGLLMFDMCRPLRARPKGIRYLSRDQGCGSEGHDVGVRCSCVRIYLRKTVYGWLTRKKYRVILTKLSKNIAFWTEVLNERITALTEEQTQIYSSIFISSPLYVPLLSPVGQNVMMRMCKIRFLPAQHITQYADHKLERQCAIREAENLETIHKAPTHIKDALGYYVIYKFICSSEFPKGSV